jgi:hypothetical protein
METYMSEKKSCVFHREMTWGDMEVCRVFILSDLPSHVVQQVFLLVAKIK